MTDIDPELVEYESEEELETTATVAAPASAKGSYVGIHAVGFKDLLLKPEIMQAIQDAAFEHPSEVQQQCIPQAILGMDVICQAKSGLGKTAVFVLATLQQLDVEESKKDKKVNILALAHTRELAFQISKEYERFTKHMKDVKCAVFYGGADIKGNIETLKEPPQVVVGTPGRLNDLINRKALDCSGVKHFVVDECDEMLKESKMRKDVQSIFMATPHQKQVMMFSATLSKEMRVLCKKFMHNPLEVFIDNEKTLTLHGLQQHYVELKENEKNRKLTDLLDALDFNQVVIFVKTTARATALTKLLNEMYFPAICIHGDMKQQDRIKTYEDFKNYQKRLLVATDLFGRGIDIERVNVVFNYDMPSIHVRKDANAAEAHKDESGLRAVADAYLHRVGRAGRFGTKGLAISFVSSEEDPKVLKSIQSRFEVNITALPDQIDPSTYMNN